LTRALIIGIFKYNKNLKIRDMSNEKQLVGQELVDFLMSRWNMTEDEALQNLAENLGNVKQ
tara:strand:+ start:1270 stop:1452 length:183 start_codon:yes stop_codon:yes gene_type:complete